MKIPSNPTPRLSKAEKKRIALLFEVFLGDKSAFDAIYPSYQVIVGNLEDSKANQS